jgi:hypothetical protein
MIIGKLMVTGTAVLCLVFAPMRKRRATRYAGQSLARQDWALRCTPLHCYFRRKRP